MASAYSTPKQFDNYVQPINTELVNFVLESKQQKFNYNIAKVEQTLSDFGQLGLIRGKDKEYLADKINSIIGEMGDIENLDWSDSNIERQITTGIKGAIDDRVRRDMAISRQVTNFKSGIQKLKEENDGSYNVANEAYAVNKAGLRDWYSGESDVLKGNLEYTPYVNVAEQYREILDESITMKHGVTRKVLSKDGKTYIESENYGISPIEIRNKVESNLTPAQLKQLEINTWSKYGNRAGEMYESIIEPQSKAIQDGIKSLKQGYDKKTDGQKAIVDAQVQTLQQSLVNLNKSKENESFVLQAVGKEELINGLSSLYKPVETSYEETVNSNYDAEQASKSINTIFDADANENETNDLSTRTRITDYEDESPDFIKNAETEIKGYRDNIRGIFNNAYNTLPTEEKEAFDIGYNDYIRKHGLEDNATNKNSYALKLYDEGGGIYSTAAVKAAKEADRRYRSKLQTKTENYNEALKEKEAVAVAKVFKNLKDTTENGNIQILDESGNKVSARSYLSGVNSIEDLSEEQKRILLKSVYADITLSQTKDYNRNTEKGFLNVNATNTFNISRLAGTLGETDKEKPMIVHPLDIIYSQYSENKYTSNFEQLKKDMQLPLQMSKGQFDNYIAPLITERGTELSSTEPEWLEQTGNFIENVTGIKKIKQLGETVYTNLTRGLGLRTVKNNIIIGGEGTKTRKALETAMAKGLYDQISLQDDSVEDDASMRSALDNREEVRELFNEKMKEDAENYAQNSTIVVEASGSREGEDVPAFEELLKQTDNLVEGREILVDLLPSGNYRAYQPETVTKSVNGEKEVEYELREDEILKRDFRRMPNFMAWVDENDSRNAITTENTKSVTSGQIPFLDKDTNRQKVMEIANVLDYTSPNQVNILTKQGARNTLLQSHPEVFQNTEAGRMTKLLMNKVLDNSHIFRVEVMANPNDLYDVAIQYQNEENKWTNLSVMPTNTNDITNTVDVVDLAPQVFLYQYLDKLFTDYKNLGVDSISEDLAALTKIVPLK